jgi:putative ABC transport system permease protein
MILLKIAFRNLREHKIKTLIIGTLIALGIAFLVIGNSVIESVTRGMQTSFSRNFTGDLIIRNTSEETVSFLPGFGSSPEILQDYSALVSDLQTQPNVLAYTPLLTGVASLSQNDSTLAAAFLWGIEPSSYQKMFPETFVLSAGDFWQEGQQGIVLPQVIIDEIKSEHGITLHVGDTLLLSGQNDITGLKIREVTLYGIGQYRNSAGILERISFVDAGTLRSLAGLTSTRLATPTTSTSTPSESEMFGSGALFSETLTQETEGSGDSLDFDNILGDTSLREQYLRLDNNAWHYLLIATTETKHIRTVSQNLSSSHQNIVLEDWRWGAGVIAELAYGMQVVLNVIILVIAVVAVIIIMNTLVISVTERISEIGTIRAIGGQRNFIRNMITSEVLMTTLMFGVVGVLLGAGVIGLLNLIGLPANNLFLQILFGGQVLKPLLSIPSLFSSMIIVTIIGIIASLYPVSVALGISPVKAMNHK